MSHLHIVLLEPEIPQNTGNIARSCAATGASLHLIKPLGFSIDDKHMKRAGLDYWDSLDLHVYENLSEFYLLNPNAKIYYFSKKAKRVYSDVAYPNNVYLMFGKETKGIPEDVLKAHEERCVRMPMRGDTQVTQRSRIEMHVRLAGHSTGISPLCLAENKMPAFSEEAIAV